MELLTKVDGDSESDAVEESESDAIKLPEVDAELDRESETEDDETYDSLREADAERETVTDPEGEREKVSDRVGDLVAELLRETEIVAEDEHDDDCEGMLRVGTNVKVRDVDAHGDCEREPDEHAEDEGEGEELTDPEGLRLVEEVRKLETDAEVLRVLLVLLDTLKLTLTEPDTEGERLLEDEALPMEDSDTLSVLDMVMHGLALGERVCVRVRVPERRGVDDAHSVVERVTVGECDAVAVALREGERESLWDALSEGDTEDDGEYVMTSAFSHNNAAGGKLARPRNSPLEGVESISQGSAPSKWSLPSKKGHKYRPVLADT